MDERITAKTIDAADRTRSWEGTLVALTRLGIQQASTKAPPTDEGGSLLGDPKEHHAVNGPVQQPLVPRDRARQDRPHGALGTAANPTVSEYNRSNARRNAIKGVDGKRFYD